MAINIVLYGPPGTGKTYKLQKKMSEYLDYDISDQQIIDVYTNHSEDWILVALIMLQNHGKISSTDIQNKLNKLNYNNLNAVTIIEQHSKEKLMPGMICNPPYVFFECETNYWYVDRLKVQQACPSFFSNFLKNSKVTQRYSFVTFHQSFSYEDFIEGIRPRFNKDTNSIDYSPSDGVFKKICKEALLHPEKEYAIFIDEINRGNLSEIFGELISLIETDKRKGTANELSVTLPYSKEWFVVPNNLNIIGTMNSADRSVGAIDIALRRRFKFISLFPDESIIEKELTLNGIDPHNIDGIDLIKLFTTINSRIELLLDRNHLLGHALFLSIRNSSDILTVLTTKIIPLLEEYFFDDLQKIQLVLNDLDSFGELKNDAIYKHEDVTVDGCFEYIGDYLLNDKKHYFIEKNLKATSLKHIYERN